MISDTLEPILNVGLTVFMWVFVTLLWVLAREWIREDTRFGNETNTPDVREYAIIGLVVAGLCALTFIVLVWTLAVMGV